MALIKSIGTAYGIPAEYHKVVELRINWHNRIAGALVGSFVNKAVRLAEANCLTYRSYGFLADGFPFTMGGNNVEETYLALKEHPDFLDAEDDL